MNPDPQFPSDCYLLRFADVSHSDLITTEDKNMQMFDLLP
jgi:hypothetical protein